MRTFAAWQTSIERVLQYSWEVWNEGLVKGLFGFQRGVTVASSDQLGLPA